ncbi:MAG: energy transducer TonB [Lysobacteraceae bacterium]|nr:MAG: energy transducer TonB [Xanthomonadaceae bacterium]
MASDLIAALFEATLVSVLALVLVLALRRPLRRWIGARLAYAAWALVPVSLLAAWLPAPAAPPLATLPSVDAALPGLLAAGGSGDASLVPALLLTLWAAGAVAMAIVQMVRQRSFERGVRRRSDQPFDETQDASPAVTGLLRPRIALPVDFHQRYLPDEQQLVIAHERMHVTRRDVPAQALASALTCVFWFNPLMHVASRRFRYDQELACDADVIGAFPLSRRRYGEAMVKTQLAGFGLPLGCHWQSSHPLTERLAMLKQPLPSALRRRVGLTLLATFVAGCAVTAWASQAPAKEAASVSLPTFRQMSAPQFPAAAKDAGISGRVDVDVNVDSDGRVTAVEVVSSEPAGVFDEATLAAVRQWTFNPGIDAATGKPAPARVRVPVRFDADVEPAISADMPE